MTRDPFSGEQLRYLRTMPRHEPISGPFNGEPKTHGSDLWVAIGAIVVAFLIATSELLGWPMP